jgi:hypothetical protein
VTVYAMTWAWEQDTGSPSERLVLLALADNAAGPDTEEPGKCWPSVALLAERTRLSTRQVERHLAALADRGVIVKLKRRRRPDGSLSVWEYLVPYHTTPASGRESATRHPRSSLHDTGDAPYTTPMSAQEPSLEPVSEPSPSGATAIAVPAEGEVVTPASEARQIATAYWEWVKNQTGHPPTGIKFIALVKLLEPALEAGYPQRAVGFAVKRAHQDCRPLTRQVIAEYLEGRRDRPMPSQFEKNDGTGAIKRRLARLQQEEAS